MMKAIKVIDRQPTLVDVPEPRGEGVKVKVVSSSICGSDIHMMAMDMFGLKREDLRDDVDGVLTVGEFYARADKDTQIIFT